MLVKWKPIRSMHDTRSLVDEFFGDTSLTPFAPNFEPRVDVKEKKNEYEISAELAGLNKDDVSITLENNTLVLKGEKKSEEKKEDENYYRSERRYGSFCRSFRLSDEIKREDISANFKDGVLNITLPKAEKAKPKEIAIKVS